MFFFIIILFWSEGRVGCVYIVLGILIFFSVRKTEQKEQNIITVVNSFSVAITAIKYLQFW